MKVKVIALLLSSFLTSNVLADIACFGDRWSHIDLNDDPWIIANSANGNNLKIIRSGNNVVTDNGSFKTTFTITDERTEGWFASSDAVVGKTHLTYMNKGNKLAVIMTHLYYMTTVTYYDCIP